MVRLVTTSKVPVLVETVGVRALPSVLLRVKLRLPRVVAGGDDVAGDRAAAGRGQGARRGGNVERSPARRRDRWALRLIFKAAPPLGPCY